MDQAEDTSYVETNSNDFMHTKRMGSRWQDIRRSDSHARLVLLYFP
mgnify:CR=1 FL=1